MPSTPRDLSSPGQAALLATAAVAIGLALQIYDGNYDPSALALIALALAMTIAAITWRVPFSNEGLITMMSIGVGTQLLMAFTQQVAMWDNPDLSLYFPFYFLLTLTGGSFALLVINPRLKETPAIGLFLIAYLGTGVWILKHAAPIIDVHMFQAGALQAFQHGRNPYNISFPGTAGLGNGYPGLLKNGVLPFGFPYPPLSLLLAGLGLPFGDIRYAHLGALTVAGGALALARPGRISLLAAGILLLSPRFGLVLQMSWTEPFCIMFLALTVFCACRVPRLVPVALGLLLASKQYLVLVAPAAVLLVPEGPDRARRAWKLILVALGVAAAITLPFVLWNIHAFIKSILILHLHTQFRLDALSFTSALARFGGPRLTWLPLVLVGLAMVWTGWRLRPSPAAFGAACALILFLFVATNKQAACNYWFLVIGALCAAVATVPDRIDRRHAADQGRPASSPS